MQFIACSIKDRSTDSFTVPSFFRAKGQATRAFIDAINNPRQDETSQMMAKYPSDYDLFYMGQWDDQTGVFEPAPKPELLAHGANARAETTQGA